ncbi:helix-turn-helix domain-containing protein [Halalkalicoccus salilacus]|uniref:helix-turn-helix domain-containing protein n=1 Tax=Halalkalicoccus salilacus TaxID=3117459 RepID=UPI00300F7A0B
MVLVRDAGWWLVVRSQNTWWTRFTAHGEEEQVSLEAYRVSNPTKPDAGPWYVLTEPQRRATRLAVRKGYYDIPRGCTTKELADELGISDQAVTERLRVPSWRSSRTHSPRPNQGREPPPPSCTMVNPHRAARHSLSMARKPKVERSASGEFA